MIIHTYDEFWTVGQPAVAAFPTPHQVEQIVAMKQWCRDSFGPPGDRWKDNIMYGEVCFKDRKDLALFVLRWA